MIFSLHCIGLESLHIYYSPTKAEQLWQTEMRFRPASWPSSHVDAVVWCGDYLQTFVTSALDGSERPTSRPRTLRLGIKTPQYLIYWGLISHRVELQVVWRRDILELNPVAKPVHD